MKNFNFSREHLPVVILDTLEREDLVIAEIGVEYGGYTDIYYPILKKSKIYLIDLWKTEGNDYYFSNNPGQVEDGYKKIIEKYNDAKNVTICKGYSSDWALNFEDEFFDWIYIDADHTTEAVLSDLKYWYPKLKKGGIISGHDYHADPSNKDYSYFGVDEAVNSFFKDVIDDVHLTNEQYYKTWAYIKPEE